MNARTDAPPALGAVMHSPVVAIAAEDTLWSAVDAMLSRGLRHLVVVRGEIAHGVLVDRELATVWALDPLGLKSRCAGDSVAPGRPFVAPDVDVVTAALRMRSLGADALVVVDERQRPLGIVTDHDLLGVLAGLLGGSGEGVGDSAPRHHGSTHPVLISD